MLQIKIVHKQTLVIKHQIKMLIKLFKQVIIHSK
jgi:hypothetical protein